MADFKNQRFFRRFRFAFAGIGVACRNEANFRIQLGIAFVVLCGLLVLRPDAVWWALAALAASAVLAAELMNSAVERLADMISDEHDPRIGALKDIAAGGVLLAAVGGLLAAAAFGVSLLLDRI